MAKTGGCRDERGLSKRATGMHRVEELPLQQSKKSAGQRIRGQQSGLVDKPIARDRLHRFASNDSRSKATMQARIVDAPDRPSAQAMRR